MATEAGGQGDRISRWRGVVLKAAQVLCECDGRAWEDLAPWEQDRYARIAALVEDAIDRMRNATGPAGAVN